MIKFSFFFFFSRRKNDKYITLRERLGEQESESPPTEPPPPESPVRDYSVQNVWTTPEPKDSTGPKVRWNEELLDEVARWEARLSLVGCTAPGVTMRMEAAGRRAAL